MSTEDLRQAQRLATALWERHWKSAAPHWKPAETMRDVLLQIDNMTVGLSRPSITALLTGGFDE